MPEKGARVIGLEKDSALGLETVFRGIPAKLRIEVFRSPISKRRKKNEGSSV
jgi:hypothetical protein